LQAFSSRANERAAISALLLATTLFADLSKWTLIARQRKMR
jgi:hypothetical protein